MFVLFLSSNGVRKIDCKDGEEEKAVIMGFPPVPVKETWPTEFSQKLGIYRKIRSTLQRDNSLMFFLGFYVCMYIESMYTLSTCIRSAY